MVAMSALPAEPWPQDPLDSERILGVLPEHEQPVFLAEYGRAVDKAHDPAGWKHLRRFLRLWAIRAIAVSEPGFYEAQDRARAGSGGGHAPGGRDPAAPRRRVSYTPWLDPRALRQMAGIPRG